MNDRLQVKKSNPVTPKAKIQITENTETRNTHKGGGCKKADWQLTEGRAGL